MTYSPPVPRDIIWDGAPQRIQPVPGSTVIIRAGTFLRFQPGSRMNIRDGKLLHSPPVPTSEDIIRDEAPQRFPSVPTARGIIKNWAPRPFPPGPTFRNIIRDEAPLRFPQSLFDELAERVYIERLEGEKEDMPALPSVVEFQRALIDGDLNAGLAELQARMHEVADVRHLRMARGLFLMTVGAGKFIPLDMTELIAEIDRDPTLLQFDLAPSWPQSLRKTVTFSIALGLGLFHAEWEAKRKRIPGLKHPLVPLIAEWFKRPSPIQLSDGRAGVLPKQIEGCRALGYLTGLPPVESQLGVQDHQLALLPPLPSQRKTVIPTVVFSTWFVSGGTMRTRGTGAPLPMRIFFEAITEMPPKARKEGGRRRLEMTLRDLRDRLFPRKRGQRHDFDPKSDIDRVRAALREVDQMRVPVRYGEHDEWADWRPVSVTLLPRPHLNSSIIFDLEVPPGEWGRRNDRPASDALVRVEEWPQVCGFDRARILLGQARYTPPRQPADPGDTSPRIAE